MGDSNLVTLSNLRTQTSKDLAKLARSEGVQGWHNMRKEQLVQALTRLLKRRGQSIASAKKSAIQTRSPEKDRRHQLKSASIDKSNGSEHKDLSVIARRIQIETDRREKLKNLALAASLNKDNKHVGKDRLVLIVRDSYWLQVYWEVTDQTMRRAKTALEKHWRGATPVLRLYEISGDSDMVPEKLVREIEVHGGVDTWFIDTPDPPKTYRAAIGYAAPNGRFYMIAKSNKVTTPVEGNHVVNGHWADIAQDCENYFAMSGGYLPDNDARELQEVFEEKLRRPMMPLNPTSAGVIDSHCEFRFEVDAQMVVYGMAAPGASVTLAGEPLKIEADGTFSVRMELPDKRQVLPVVACSRDGAHQRTTVLAIERNTKVMEPLNMDSDEP